MKIVELIDTHGLIIVTLEYIKNNNRDKINKTQNILDICELIELTNLTRYKDITSTHSQLDRKRMSENKIERLLVLHASIFRTL